MNENKTVPLSTKFYSKEELIKIINDLKKEYHCEEYDGCGKNDYLDATSGFQE